MATGVRTDPYRGFNFRLEVDGLTVASFSEVSGLVAEGDPVPYREGDEKVNWSRQLVGLRKYNNITFKRGYTQNKELWVWARNIANGLADRRNGTVVLMDEARNDVMRWSFRNAWVNKIEAPHFNAAGNEVVMESIEICHEGIELEV
jgi:phage tail-like protein